MTQELIAKDYNTNVYHSLKSVEDLSIFSTSTELRKWIQASNPTSHFFAKQVHKKLKKLSRCYLTLIDPQGVYQFGNDTDDTTDKLEAFIYIKDMNVYKEVALGGTNDAAEAYIQGKWLTNDLTNVVKVFTRNRKVMMNMEQGLAKLASIMFEVWHRRNKNTKSGSRRNIATHYDLGNDFFKLFLDDEMMYSSYLYNEKDTDSKEFDQTIMQEASNRKMQRICDQLELSQHDHLVEIGTGWGGFACFSALSTGCKVTTTTISKEQYKRAVERVKSYKLEDKVTVLLEDYRDLKGQYDKLVSIEMIEAVGHEFLPNYFSKLEQLLKPNGKALIQAITIEDHLYNQARKACDYIKRYIFPGGFLPSVSEMTKHAGKNGLILQNLFDMGPSYAKTLRDWRIQFFEKNKDIHSQGFDERFIRMWEYYLCYCEGGFDEKAISVVQANFRKNYDR